MVSVRTLIYWLIPTILLIAGGTFFWPRETPTFTRQVWIPDAEIKRDEILASQWLRYPAGPWGFQDFRRKSEKRQYTSVWVFTTKLKNLIGSESTQNDWQIIYLGSQGGKTIESTSVPVGDLLSRSDTWFHPITIGSADLGGDMLVVRTQPDWAYPVWAAIVGLVLGIIIDLIIRDVVVQRPRTLYLQLPFRSPLRVLKPVPAVSDQSIPKSAEEGPKAKGKAKLATSS